MVTANVRAVELVKETENARVTLAIRVKHALNVITNSTNHSVTKQSCCVADVMQLVVLTVVVRQVDLKVSIYESRHSCTSNSNTRFI